jgi:hypothetical protein
MIDYQNGKIYKMEFDGHLYVGSTAKKRLCQRRARHLHDYTCPKNATMPLYINIKAREQLWEGVKFILVETFPCNSEDELRAREQHWIDTLQPDLNKHRAFSSPKDAKRKKQESTKAYCAANRETLNATSREWQMTRVDCKFCERSLKNGSMQVHIRRVHPEQDSESDKYIQRQKETASSKVQCPTCSKELRKDGLRKHVLQKHST